jgi:hypothetical protein
VRERVPQRADMRERHMRVTRLTPAPSRIEVKACSTRK